MTAILNQMAEKWFSWQLSLFWQVGLLLTIVAGLDLLIKKWAWPQVRYALWLLVLVKLVLPPSLTSPTSFTAEIPFVVKQTLTNTDYNTDRQIPTIIKPVEPAAGTMPIENVILKPSNDFSIAVGDKLKTLDSRFRGNDIARGNDTQVSIRWKVYVFFIWLGGVMILSGWLIVRLRNLRHQYLKDKSPLNLPERLEGLLVSTAQKLNLRKIPQVILTNKVCCPAVFGIFQPVLLMPAGKLANLTTQDAENIFLHELAHIKRGDLFVHAVYMILQIVYWLNPLLWLIRKHLQNLRELCCDATVARLLKEKTIGYRQTLLETTRQLLAQPVEPGLGLLGLFENSSWLVDRLHWLEKKSWKYRPLRITIIFILICFMSAFVLPMTKFEAPADFVIKGTVTDTQTGKPIAGAIVGDVVTYAYGKYNTTTDANGNYSYKTYYEEHILKCRAAGYKIQSEILLTKIFGKEKEKVINFALEPNRAIEQANSRADENSQEPAKQPAYPIDFEITKQAFLQGDSIEITEILGSDDKLIETSQTYTIKGIYKLSSADQAMLCIYCTNGKIDSEQGPAVKRGEGDFTRTFTYQREGWLHLSFYPAAGGSSFGSLYFAQKGSGQKIPDIPRITDVISVETSKPAEEGETVDLAQIKNVMVTLGGTFSAAHSAAFQQNSTISATKIMEEALPQFEKFESDVKGTNISGSVHLIIEQIRQIIKANKDGDSVRVKALIQASGESWYKLIDAIMPEAKSRQDVQKKKTEILNKNYIPQTSTINEQGQIVDKLDYPFVDDPQVVGTWKSIDFVNEIEQFQPGERQWKGDLYLRELVILPQGKTFKSWLTWTKGLIFHSGDKTASKYVIKDMAGSTYMFFEWKSGDYSIRGMKPKYYVLQKSAQEKIDENLPTDLKAFDQWSINNFKKYLECNGYESSEDNLINQLTGGKDENYYKAINSLACIQSKKAIPSLAAIAFTRKEKDNRDRWMATRALGLISDKTVTGDLIHLIYYPNSNTRLYARISLIRLTGKDLGPDWRKWAVWFKKKIDNKFSTAKIDWSKNKKWMDERLQMQQDQDWLKNIKEDWEIKNKYRQQQVNHSL